MLTQKQNQRKRVEESQATTTNKQAMPQTLVTRGINISTNTIIGKNDTNTTYLTSSPVLPVLVLQEEEVEEEGTCPNNRLNKQIMDRRRHHQDYYGVGDDYDDDDPSSSPHVTSSATTNAAATSASAVAALSAAIASATHTTSSSHGGSMSIKAAASPSSGPSPSPGSGGVSGASPSPGASSNAAKASRFPFKLHEMLQDSTTQNFEHIVSWVSVNTTSRSYFEAASRISPRYASRKNDDDDSAVVDGFKVHQFKEFQQDIMPKYFQNQTKYKSFLRQLNLYGFVRINTGVQQGTYVHPYFSRSNPELCNYIKRERLGGTSSTTGNPTASPTLASGSSSGPHSKSSAMRKRPPSVGGGGGGGGDAAFTQHSSVGTTTTSTSDGGGVVDEDMNLDDLSMVNQHGASSSFLPSLLTNHGTVTAAGPSIRTTTTMDVTTSPSGGSAGSSRHHLLQPRSTTMIQVPTSCDPTPIMSVMELVSTAPPFPGLQATEMGPNSNHLLLQQRLAAQRQAYPQPKPLSPMSILRASLTQPMIDEIVYLFGSGSDCANATGASSTFSRGETADSIHHVGGIAATTNNAATSSTVAATSNSSSSRQSPRPHHHHRQHSFLDNEYQHYTEL